MSEIFLFLPSFSLFISISRRFRGKDDCASVYGRKGEYKIQRRFAGVLTMQFLRTPSPVSPCARRLRRPKTKHMRVLFFHLLLLLSLILHLRRRRRCSFLPPGLFSLSLSPFLPKTSCCPAVFTTLLIDGSMWPFKARASAPLWCFSKSARPALKTSPAALFAARRDRLKRERGHRV